jgi:UDP-N-acetylglucosamine 2-epimerase (non-hydrolysing)
VKILHVAGARPNFMKLAPVLKALQARGADNIVVHTGQHYDHRMSQAFFDDLGLPDPDHHLEVGSGSHAVQTARIMEAFEPVLTSQAPDLTLVIGDVNSTIAAALVATKLGFPVGHVEAGLRSFDRSMPEEINRVLTDQISDLLLTTSPEAQENLVREGVSPEQIHFVGNPMIDSLQTHRARAATSDILDRLEASQHSYALVTLHRPANVDDPSVLGGILEALVDLAKETAVLFPAHPRTVKMMDEFGLQKLVSIGAPAKVGSISVIEPVGYLDFLKLMDEAALVLTDSGGIQEETTVLGVPCLTLRWNTERPITCTMGTNKLIGTDPAAIRKHGLEALRLGRSKDAQIPPLWDGKAGERIADVILQRR